MKRQKNHAEVGTRGAEHKQKRFGQRTLRRNNEYKKTCNYPNRLNLLNLTAGLRPTFKFFTKIPCLCSKCSESEYYVSDLVRITAGLAVRHRLIALLRREFPAAEI